jgi:hypothetical protein
MPQPRDEASFVQEAERSVLRDVDHQRVVRLATADERDDAVVARGAVTSDAGAAVDDDRFHAAIIPRGCDSRRQQPGSQLIELFGDSQRRRIGLAVSAPTIVG